MSTRTDRPTVVDRTIAGMSLEQYATWATSRAKDVYYEIEPGARDRETVRVPPPAEIH